MAKAIILIFISMLISASFVLKNKSEKSFIYIVLPSIFLFPNSFFFQLNSLPLMEITIPIASLLVISAWYVFFKIYEAKFTYFDFLILLYIVAQFIIGIIKGEFGFSFRVFQSDLIQNYFLYFFARYYFRNSKLLKKSLKIIVIINILMLIFAPMEMFQGKYIIKYFWLSSYPFLQQAPRWGLNRIQLFFPHPIIAGICYSIFSIISVYFFVHTKIKKEKIFWGISVVLTFIGVVFSISRGTIAFLMIFYLVYFLERKKINYKFLFIIGIIFFIVFKQEFSSHEEVLDDSANYRLNLIMNIDELIGQSMWIGYGGNIKYTGKVGYAWNNEDTMTIDNFYLYRVFTGGIISLSLFMFLIFRAYYEYLKLKEIKECILEKDMKFVNLAIVVIFFIVINYFFVANMYTTDLILYIMFGIISANYEKYILSTDNKVEYKFKRIL
ncbi:O-antigen ligase-like membrane protein [Hypnocyclicus thermotrophus]|uniref:O-antigen ligase-like membrane protein n=1 Tax=Hypnocyclicus thermotrophus TaxID=1627895 RepID=A0AA46E0A0_9FUSO|nr:O-antigen ligase family protein [Hypnocyclicus thermotrophus]TDT72442.1 O-antigen ligase-like membrane protein [Hypnocyclicus thermotrophus]